mmetsp:Transcript_65269/g.155955  ORF Transcript_65269/g.155955 Transcript_65269/m.155955 type:complete len:251 (-) Transcript_65269:61-813(-)
MSSVGNLRSDKRRLPAGKPREIAYHDLKKSAESITAKWQRVHEQPCNQLSRKVIYLAPDYDKDGIAFLPQGPVGKSEAMSRATQREQGSSWRRGSRGRASSRGSSLPASGAGLVAAAGDYGSPQRHHFHSVGGEGLILHQLERPSSRHGMESTYQAQVGQLPNWTQPQYGVPGKHLFHSQPTFPPGKKLGIPGEGRTSEEMLAAFNNSPGPVTPVQPTSADHGQIPGWKHPDYGMPAKHRFHAQVSEVLV